MSMRVLLRGTRPTDPLTDFRAPGDLSSNAVHFQLLNRRMSMLHTRRLTPLAVRSLGSIRFSTQHYQVRRDRVLIPMCTFEIGVRGTCPPSAARAACDVRRAAQREHVRRPCFAACHQTSGTSHLRDKPAEEPLTARAPACDPFFWSFAALGRHRNAAAL